MTEFTDFPFAPVIAKALAHAGYDKPTPIQAQAIPFALEGRDVLGIAQTGTGKTLAFAAPILSQIVSAQERAPQKGCLALVLAPTRELAAQIAKSFETYGEGAKLRTVVAFGGVNINPQKQKLARGAHVLVATPGRLEDLMRQKAVTLEHVRHLVLDEADQMMDLGFIHALKRIAAALPRERQTLFFSATMPKSIEKLAGEFLNQPEKVAVAPPASTAERVAQKAYFIAEGDKPALLATLLKGGEGIGQVIVFTRTKHGADRLVKQLDRDGIGAAAIHGNKSQNQRQRALGAFREGKLMVLIATDIAARGIDISGLGHVINFELPNVPEQYVHRIGRTGRADKAGTAISLVAGDEKSYLRAIQKLTGQTIDKAELPEGFAEDTRDLPPKPQGQKPQRRGQSQQRRKPGGQSQGKPAGAASKPKRRRAPRKAAGNA
jgi:ATP-dependent RNA helicase RhlE